mmetsp:Transcript_10353/g.31194  ORF Transcript_10353/g.31194 Transcript_10353/m.31194 type:complete len:257 (+) Transcript_10353:64-834(+)
MPPPSLVPWGNSGKVSATPQAGERLRAGLRAGGICHERTNPAAQWAAAQATQAPSSTHWTPAKGTSTRERAYARMPAREGRHAHRRSPPSPLFAAALLLLPVLLAGAGAAAPVPAALLAAAPLPALAPLLLPAGAPPAAAPPLGAAAAAAAPAGLLAPSGPAFALLTLWSAAAAPAALTLWAFALSSAGLLLLFLLLAAAAAPAHGLLGFLLELGHVLLALGLHHLANRGLVHELAASAAQVLLGEAPIQVCVSVT